MLKMKSVLACLMPLAMVAVPVAAAASQGPGGGPGTAGHATQLAMAILVYGCSALIVGGGLIAALKDVRR